MNLADWRALIEAYLDGRLSAEAFARRFMDAWSIDRERGLRAPAPVEDLAVVVEAFDADVAAVREEGVNDDELRQAAQRALTHLRDGAPAMSRGPSFRGARDGLRVQFSGCAGLGCVFALIWVGLCLLQVFAVSDQIQSVLDWSAAPATFVGLIIAFIPIVGNVIAFFGAVDVWEWPAWLAAIVFFAAPAAAVISGWTRWRAPRR